MQERVNFDVSGQEAPDGEWESSQQLVSQNISAVANLLLWMHTFAYLRGFRGFGELTRMIIEVIKDMSNFLAVMLIMTISIFQSP